jgi:hypothetical protein
MRSAYPIIAGLTFLATLSLTGPWAARAEDTNQADVTAVCTKDLADRLNVNLGQIRLVTIRPEVWGDASLGHPEPGMVYVQMLVTGFRVVLDSPNGQHEYHTDAKGRCVYCGATKPDASGPPQVVVACQDDLMARLRLRQRPQIIEVLPVVWPDTSLGIPHPEARFAAMPTPGYRALLAARNELWQYHTARTTTFECAGKARSVALPGDQTIILLRKTSVPGAYDLCLRRVDGLAEKPLIRNVLPDFGLSFAASRDGQILAITGKPETKCTLGLYSADGKRQRQIATRPLFQHPAWSADGTRFAVWMPRPDRPADSVLAVGQPGGGELQITATLAPGRTGSPLLWAGDWALCHTRRDHTSLTAAYDTVNKQSQGFFQLGEALAVSRDGKRVLLRDDNETPPGLWLNEGRSDRRTPVGGAVDVTAAAFLPGGNELLLTRNAKLLRRNAAGNGDERLLATLPGPIVSLSLDPLKGQQALVVCADKGGGSFRLCLVDVDSGAVQDAGSADAVNAAWLVIPDR